jgi:hypothetical protein
MRVALEAVVTDIGSPRWWKRWTLFYCAGSTDMAADVIGYTPVPLCWGGLPGGPEYGTASWGGFLPQRYVVYLCMILIYQCICLIYRH